MRFHKVIVVYNLYDFIYYTGVMKASFKRKNYLLDETRIKRVQKIFKVKTETEAIQKALDLVVFQKDILKSLEKVKGKGHVSLPR